VSHPPRDASAIALGTAPVNVLTVLTRFAHELAGESLTRHQLFGRLADMARYLLDAEGAAVLETVDSDHYAVVAPSGTAGVYDGQRFPILGGASVFREALRLRQPQFSNDSANDGRVHPEVTATLGIRQVAVAPIVLHDTVGLLAVINPASGRIDEQSIAVLEYLAAQGAVVMRTQQLLDRTEQTAAEARLRAEDAARAARANAILAASARAFADAPNRESLLACLASVIRGEFRAVGFALYEATPTLRTARFVYQWGAASIDGEQIAARFWRTPLGDIVRQGQPVFVEHFAADQEFASLAAPLLAADVHSAALLPLLIEERAQGLLSVRFAGPHAFDDDEKSLLADLAAQFALAYRNTIYVDDVERRALRLTVLARAQQQLTQLASEDNLAIGIAEAVQLVLPSRACDVFTVVGTAGAEGTSENGAELRRVVRLENGQLVSIDIAPLADTSLARLTASSGVSRLACHLEAGVDVTRGVTELCAAVRFGQRSAGVIRVLSAPERPFDAQDLDLLTIIARHAGTAVETARLFALQDLQRQRAEGAAELARVTLEAVNIEDGAAELLVALDRFVPSIGKAIGVARGRDGIVEYIAGSGTLDVLRGHRPGVTRDVSTVSPDGKPVVFESLRDAAPEDLAIAVPDEWAFVVPLAARERVLGVLLVTAPRQAPLQRRDRLTLERLSSSLALALDALLLDEEERLAREREHLLATALTTINHPIFILDRLGVRYANPAAAREYGWSQQELMDMRFEELVVGEDARQGLDTQSGVVEAGVRLSNDVHRRQDGSEFPAAVTVSPLLGHDGDVLGQVVSVRNVSQDRRLEEQLRHTEKMVALGELVGGMAHEINNPLTGISAFAQILLEEELSADQRESVQLIKQESDRATGVISDLLLFARKTERGAEPVDVNTVLEQTLRLRAYPLRVAKVSVQLELDPSRPRVSGDIQKLQQVFLNVVGNAEHAMQGRAQRTLTLRTAIAGDRVVISASDTGSGMNADTRRRIFEPFFSTKPAGVGTGLGLSVAYGIINAHGGTIAVDSEPDVGTTVRIEIPALSAPSA
jgi:two-component system, NtrC family, sensor kinase